MSTRTKNPAADSLPVADMTQGPRHWLFRDIAIPILVAGIVGVASIWGQSLIDDQRAARERAAAEVVSDQLNRLENLRFVRERSAEISALGPGDGQVAKELPFTGMDLEGQNLSFLDLRGADFTGAKLKDVSFFNAKLEGAVFRDVQLTNAIFVDARLDGAVFDQSSLVGADFTGSQGGKFTDVCWDHTTKSPPPPEARWNLCGTSPQAK